MWNLSATLLAWFGIPPRRPGLFCFWDGDRWRYADPFQVWRAIFNHPTMNARTMIDLAEQGQEPEATIVATALREIFGVGAWDDAKKTGLTDWEVLDLMVDFGEYLARLKKSISPGRTPLVLMAYGSSTSPEGPDATGNSSSDSGSTPDDKTPGGPTPSSAGHATP